jgi:hypothetical protein
MSSDDKTFTRTFRARGPLLVADDEMHLENDWWEWGQYVDLAQPDDQTVEREWTGFVRLKNLDGDASSRHIDLDGLTRGDPTGGSSNFQIDPQMKEPRISLGFTSVTYVLRRGESNQLGAIEIPGIRARTAREAMELARAHFNLLSVVLTFSLQLPLRESSVCVRPADAPNPAMWRVYHPWPNATLSPLQLQVLAPSVTLRLLALYAEGVQSSSVAYRFLTFFKIVDHVLNRSGALRRFHNNKYAKSDWHELQGTLSSDPTQYYDMDLVGKRYTAARDRYRDSELRNSIGHVLSTDLHFEPLDPQEAAHYRAASVVCRIMAHDLIQLVGLNAAEMGNLGATAEEMNAVLYPPASR